MKYKHKIKTFARKIFMKHLFSALFVVIAFAGQIHTAHQAAHAAVAQRPIAEGWPVASVWMYDLLDSTIIPETIKRPLSSWFGISEARYRDLYIRLVTAIQRGNLLAATAALTRGAKITSRNYLDETMLMMAIDHSNEDMVKMILQRDEVDINAQDLCKRTALIKAVLKRNPRMVQILLDKKADITKKDMNGKTAEDYAQIDEWSDNTEEKRENKRIIQKLISNHKFAQSLAHEIIDFKSTKEVVSLARKTIEATIQPTQQEIKAGEHTVGFEDPARIIAAYLHTPGTRI